LFKQVGMYIINKIIRKTIATFENEKHFLIIHLKYTYYIIILKRFLINVLLYSLYRTKIVAIAIIIITVA